MSDTSIAAWSPLDAYNALAAASEFYRANELNMRAKALTRVNPTFANNPQALMTMAGMPGDTVDLVRNSAAMFAAQTADTLRADLEGMTEQEQRGFYDRLTPSQQMALHQQGYKVPKRDENSWYEPITDFAGGTAELLFQGVGGAADKLGLDHALNGLIWLGDRPMHLYRAIRTMDTEAQLAAIAGAALAIGAVIAAPVTAGGSLLTIPGIITGTISAGTIYGGAAILGGTVAAAATNPTDWYSAFKASYDGERTFERQAVEKATQLLGDPRLVNAAKDVAHLLPAGLTVNRLATEAAGIRSRSSDAQVEALQEFAKQFATEGTPEYNKILEGATFLLAQPQFQEAINVLQNGKISIGRDLADGFAYATPGDLAEPGSALHKIISGAGDAAALLMLDPFLIGSKAVKGVRAYRYGLSGVEGEAFAARFQQIAQRKPVRNHLEKVAAAIDKGDYTLLRRVSPEHRDIYTQILEHRRNIGGTFGADQLVDWITAQTNMTSVLQGFGTLRGMGNSALIVTRSGPVRDAFQKAGGRARAFTNGLTDVRSEAQLVKYFEELMRVSDSPIDVNRRLFLTFPELSHGDLRVELMRTHLSVLEDRMKIAADRLDELTPEARRILQADAAASGARSTGKTFTFKDGSVVNLDGIEMLDPSFVPMVDELDRLTAVIADDILQGGSIPTDLLFDLAMRSEDFVNFRRAGRWLASVPVAGKVAGGAGRFITKATTMAPKGSYLQFEGPGSEESIRTFVEMAALGDMPQWLRRDWTEMLVNLPSPNLRLSMTQSFYENMLRMAGVHNLDDGEQLIMEFTNQVRKAYAPGGIDLVNLQTHWTSRTLYPDEVADGVFAPDLKELARAVRTGWWAKTMRLVDNSGLDAFQNQVWKPAVLLRIGFIPRAAGEEMLSFMLRGGYGSLGQEFGARSLSRRKEYERVAALVNEGGIKPEQLPELQRAILNQGPLVSGARWIDSALSRYDFTHPIDRIWREFVQWSQENILFPILREGVAGGRYERAAEAALTKLGGVPLELAPRAEDLSRITVRNRALSPNQRSRAAFAQSVDSILFGTANSWRRMLAGGVHDDLVEASDAWFQLHGAGIMRAVGTTVAAPINPGTTPDSMIELRMEKDWRGEERLVEFIRIRGERVMRPLGDGLANNALHQEFTRLANDEFTANEILPQIARILPPDMPINDVALVAGAWHSQDGSVARSLIAEFLDQPDADRLLALYRQWQRSDDEALRMLGQRLEVTIDETDLTLANAVSEWQRTIRTGRPAGAPDPISGRRPRGREDGPVYESQLADVVQFANEIIPRLDGMTAGQRSWLAGYVRNIDNVDAQALVYRVAADAPDIASRTRMVAGEPLFRFGNKSLQWFDKENTLFVQPLYNTWDEMYAAALPRIEGALRNPIYARRLGHVQGIEDKTSLIDPKAVAPHRRTVEQAWVPPAIADVTVRDGISLVRKPIEELTGDELLRIMTSIDGPLTVRYEAETLAWLGEVQNGRRAAVADRALADLITKAITHDAPGGFGRAQMWSMPLENMLKNADSGVSALVRDARNNPSVFAVEDWVPWNLQYESVSFDESVRLYAERMLANAKARTMRGTSRTFRPRERLLDDGTRESMVFTKQADGELLPLESYKRYTARDQEYYDRFGNRIQMPDSRYWEDELVVGGDSVINEILGPVLQDAADVRQGMILTARKGQLRSTVGYDVDPDALVRMYRSKVEHVQRAGDGLPQWVEAMDFKVRRMNVWDRFKRFGFDKVIGPSIDALARRPMSFHFFAQRYKQNMQALGWTLDKNLVQKVDEIATRIGTRATVELDLPDGTRRVITLSEDDSIDNARQVAEHARKLAMVDGGMYEAARSWSQNNALAWLRGHDEASMTAMFDRVDYRLDTYVDKGRISEADADDIRISLNRLRDRSHSELTTLMPAELDGQNLLAYVRKNIGMDDARTLARGRPIDPESEAAARYTAARGRLSPAMRKISDGDWGLIVRLDEARQRMVTVAAENASIAAINDMIPYIDSHEYKTQIAEIGRPFLPFWYAEENFLKRWVRTLSVAGPDVIRKAQLMYMGLKSAGTIRTDNSGKDWLIWPGSGVLQDAINELPFAADLPVGTLFQSPTDSIIPGFNARSGIPQFGPMVALPIDLLAATAPELETFQRKVIGDVGATRGVLEQIVPTPLLRTYAAIMSDNDPRLESAKMSAMAFLAAQDKFPPPDASAAEMDEFYREINNHARIIVLAQAALGFISPGPLSQMTVDDEDDLFTFGGQDPSQVLNSMYLDLVRTLGIEEGTNRFLELTPYADLTDIVNPEMFTVSRGQSRSGAPLPATENAVAFYDDNKAYLDGLPFAGPWLLPPDVDAKDERTIYAYDQQTVNGMRKRITPLQFMNELKYKEGANRYFAERKNYFDALDQARAANNQAAVTALNETWASWSDTFLKTHPVFADELRSSEAKVRRGNVLREMRVLVADPDAPDSPMLPLLRQMIADYDVYLTRKAEFALDGSALGRQRTEQLKGLFETYMEDFVAANPAARSFWLGVLRPESALD